MPLSVIIKKIRKYINKIEMAATFAQANDDKDAKDILKTRKVKNG